MRPDGLQVNEMMRALYVVGEKTSSHAAYEKYADNVYAELKKLEGLEISEVGISSPIQFPFRQHALEYAILPWKVRLSHKDDIVHASHQGLAHVLFGHSHRKVATCLDVIPFAFPKDYATNWLRRRLLWIMRKGLQSADEIVTISKFSAKEIEKHLQIPASSMTIAYPAVDASVFKPGKPITAKTKSSKTPKTILYVGSEQPRKNLGVLLEAFARAKKTFPSLRLVKVGKPQWKTGRHDFLAKARGLGVEKDIKFVEGVGESQLAQLYQKADLFAFPSLYEGFGMPPLEAMACGTPVVCSNASSLPEVTGDAALSFNPKDAGELAEKMLKVLGSEKTAASLKQKGIRRAKQFTWENAARQVLKAYEKAW